MHKNVLAEKPAEPETENLLLRKLYRKGYRNGWDSVQSEKDSNIVPEPDSKGQ